MIRQQRKFVVIIKDRGPRAWAVIGKAKALGQFLVNARKPQEVGVFGADHGDGGGVDAAVGASGIGGDGAIGVVGQVAYGSQVSGADTRQPWRGAGDCLGPLVLVHEKHQKVGIVADADRVPRRLRQTVGIAGHVHAVAGALAGRHGWAELNPDPDGALPAAQFTRHAGARACAVIFVEKDDLFKVARQHICGKRRIRPAAIAAQEALGQLAGLHLRQIPAQGGALLGCGLRRGRRRAKACGPAARRQHRLNRHEKVAGRNKAEGGDCAPSACCAKYLRYFHQSSLSLALPWTRCRPPRPCAPWQRPACRADRLPFS
mmetsp:Transcript_97/g.265  ORF Transcript_97/g.265 Transcript_97/m.265 type:complete len:317 (-) Transcript_97:567-1517(-)